MKRFNPYDARPFKRHKALHFNESGKYIEQADKERAEARLLALKNRVAKAMDNGLKDVLKNIAAAAPVIESSQHPLRDLVVPPILLKPEVEWWDIVNPSCIHGRVLHPATIPQVNKLPEQMMLTKREQQKMRRQRRLKEQKDRADRVRLGLDLQETKVKVSTIMRVLKNSVQDPTLMELKTKEQTQARKEKHIQDNQSRKLDKEEKRMKQIARKQRNEEMGLYCSVYRVPELESNLTLAKICKNANQMGLCGVALSFKHIKCVLVEGGSRGIRQFQRLILHRMQWEAKLLWEGPINVHAFNDFSVKPCVFEAQALDTFRSKNVSHYWSLVTTFT